MVQLNDFGVAVKKRLIDLGQTQTWLIRQVRETSGMFLDNGYLQKLMTGRAVSAPMMRVIAEILELPGEDSA